MKKIHASLSVPFILFCMLTGYTHSAFAQKKINVLIISGGHGFQHQPFYDVFTAIPSITYDTLVQLGHGPSGYSNPNYRKLIQQAIEWAANHSKK